MTVITQNLIAELLALATSFAFYNILKKGKLKSLPFFLLFIVLVELTGSFLRKVLHHKNAWLYNFSIPIEYSYYLYLFQLHTPPFLKSFFAVCIALLGGLAVYYFLAAPFDQLHSVVLLTGQIAVIIAACLYLYLVFRSNDDYPLYLHYFFWFMTGLFLFNLGDFCYFLIYPATHKTGLDKFDHLFKLINNNLSLLLYLTYIIGIIIYRKYNTTPQHARYF